MAKNRFCESCGARLVDAVRFCESCGAPVPEAAEAVPKLQPAATVAGGSRPATGERASRSAWLLPAAALLVVSVIAVVLFLRDPADTGSALESAAPSPSATPTDSYTASPQAETAAALSRADIEALKAEVVAANRAHVDAILSEPDPPLAFRVAVDEAIGALGQGLYRFHVLQEQGSLDDARAEMRGFLEGLNDSGFGLSAPVIDLGVDSVAP
jgi:hypothetical protein